MPHVQMAGGTFATTAGLLTAAGTETVYDTTVTLNYCINGIQYAKTAVTDGTCPTTDIVTGATFATVAACKGCYFVWMINAAGTVAVAQGSIRGLQGTTGANEDFVDENLLPQFPAIPDAYCPFAIQMVKNDSGGGDFVFGNDDATNDWEDVNDLIHDILTMPDKPVDMTTA